MTNLNWGTLVLTLYCLAHGVQADGGHPQDDLVGLTDWRYVFKMFLFQFLAKIICHKLNHKWIQNIEIGVLCFIVSVKRKSEEIVLSESKNILSKLKYSRFSFSFKFLTANLHRGVKSQ